MWKGLSATGNSRFNRRPLETGLPHSKVTGVLQVWSKGELRWPLHPELSREPTLWQGEREDLRARLLPPSRKSVVLFVKGTPQ